MQPKDALLYMVLPLLGALGWGFWLKQKNRKLELEISQKKAGELTQAVLKEAKEAFDESNRMEADLDGRVTDFKRRLDEHFKRTGKSAD